MKSPESTLYRAKIGRHLLLVWLLALVPRLLATIPFLNHPIALDDMFQYDMLARSLLSGNGYRWYSQADLEALRPYYSQFLDFSQLNVPEEGLETTFRPPGYPFFLAGIYALTEFEQRFMWVRLIQCALGALSAPLTALLASALGLKRREAVAAGVVMAIYPILWMYPIALASENLFIPLVIASLLGILWAAKKSSPGWGVIPGMLLGTAMLTRSVLFLFVLLAAVWMARFGLSRWRGSLVMVLVAFGLCLPWAVRNSLLMGKPSYIDTSLSYQLYISYHPGGNGSFISRFAIEPLAILDDAQRDAFCSQHVWDFVRSDPLGSALTIVYRTVYFFGVEDREIIYFYTNGFFGPIAQPWLTLIYLYLILPWIGVGLLSPLGFRKPPVTACGLLAALFVGGYTLPHLLILAEPRFHLAIVPVLIPFAIKGWSSLRQGWLQMEQSARARFQERLLNWLVRFSVVFLAILWVWGFATRWKDLIAILSPGGDRLRLYY